MLTNKQEITFFSFLGVILAILLAISFIIGHRIRRENISSPTQVVRTDVYNDIHLSAKSAFVYDIRTGQVLFSKNADERLPLASLVKVMTALVATDLAPGYSTVVISKEAIETDGDSGLRVGEKWTLKKLIDFSLTSSSNDGMRAVGLALGALNHSEATSEQIEADFVSEMNKKATAIGMSNTHFYNDTGLDENFQKSGAYGSAKDMALLFTYILQNHPELMSATKEPRVVVTSEDNVLHTAHNTDLVVNNIPGLKASKTGFTDLAGGNLVVAFDPELGRPIVISVLGSTEAGRFQDVLKLVDATLVAIQN